MPAWCRSSAARSASPGPPQRERGVARCAVPVAAAGAADGVIIDLVEDVVDDKRCLPILVDLVGQAYVEDRTGRVREVERRRSDSFPVVAHTRVRGSDGPWACRAGSIGRRLKVEAA